MAGGFIPQLATGCKMCEALAEHCLMTERANCLVFSVFVKVGNFGGA